MSFVKKHSKAFKIIIFSSIVLFAGSFFTYSFFFQQPKPQQEQTQAEQTDKQSEDVSTEENANEEAKQKEEKKPEKKKSEEVDTVQPKTKPSGNYTKLYPDFYAEKPSKQITPSKTVFLTFDDGPSERTKEILKILKEKNVKATFFVIGNASEGGKALMRQIVDEGHTIAMHTYSHEFKKIYASVESYLDDMYKIYKLIYETTGQKPSIFRFAGGSNTTFNKAIRRELIAEMLRRGFYYYDWNLSTGDAAQKALTPADNCVSNVLKYSAKYNSAVVLAHDARPKTTTVQALPRIIDGLRNQGFTFDKLSNQVNPTTYSLTKPYA